MNSTIQTYQWTNKTTLSRHLVFGSIILILGIIVAFKMKPYFSKPKKIAVLSPQEKPSISKMQEAKMKEDLSKANLATKNPSTNAENHVGHTTYSESTGSSLGHHERASRNQTGRVLERPLFDNLTVMVSAVLLTGISSSQSESGSMAVEAKILGIVTDEAALAVDRSDFSFEGSTLLGMASPQFGLKKMNLQFTELVTSEGKRFPIVGVALDPQSNAVGVPAAYSSGIASRLLGVTLGRALQTTDHIVTSRVLENTSEADPLKRAFAQQGIEATQQPVTELNQEVTKDLRETKAVLTLEAGTPFIVRLKAQAANGVRRSL